MHNVIERILNLLAFLLTVNRPVTADEIRFTVKGYDQPSDEAFRRTFERDKDLLRSLGVPLDLTATDIWEVELGYVVPSDEYVLDDPGLTEEERSALYFAAEAVKFGGQPTEMGALFKLGGSQAPMSSPVVAADLGQGLEVLGLLFEAVSERRRITFDYRDKGRVVHPYGLVHRNGRWYVVGPEKGDTIVKAFRVDRMGSVAVKGDAGQFERPRRFDPARALAGASEVRGDAEATVHVDTEIASVAMARWPTSERITESDGTTILRIRYDDAWRAVQWALSFDDRIEIMEPADLRERLIAHVEGAQ